jgi:hypothetical protein
VSFDVVCVLGKEHYGEVRVTPLTHPPQPGSLTNTLSEYVGLATFFDYICHHCWFVGAFRSRSSKGVGGEGGWGRIFAIFC